MKKIISLLLVLLTFSTMNLSFAASDAIPRSSYYIDICALSLSADGDGEMTVDFSVDATYKMIKVGVYSITLEKEQTSDVWKSIKTVYGSSDPNLFYSNNAYTHTGSYTFTDLTPGARYRVKMIGYAQDRNGSDTSELTSKPKTCK